MKITKGQLAIAFICCASGSRCLAADVLTYHNDNARTGLNSQETALTPLNVNANSFGRLFTLQVDGKVDAQPLYVSNAVVFSGSNSLGSHNLVIVATEHDSIYAFDADTGVPYWHSSLVGPGETPSDDRGCGQVTPEIGVTATPVIDRSNGANGANGTIYVVAMSKLTTTYHQRLHALNLATGQEVPGSPMEIQASYPGSGPSNDRIGHVIFDPGAYKERPGLLLLDGIVYTAWSSHCDIAPYTAWIIGYNEKTLAQATVLNVDPNGPRNSTFLSDGSGNSFWNSGAGPAADANGNIYALTANGPFETSLVNGFPSAGDYGDTFLKLSTQGGLAVSDYFTPFNQASDAANDTDLGSGGAVVLPDLIDASGVTRHLAVGAGKDSNIYLVDRDHMGKYIPGAIANSYIYQELVGALPEGEWATAAYFNGSIYYGPVGGALRRFTLSQARLVQVPAAITSTVFAYPGTTPSISSSGDSEGIVWAYENPGSGSKQAVIHAYDATSLTELYNSNQNPERDQFGAANKFITPTICNGKVFVAATSSVGVFGLLPFPSVDFNGDGEILWRNASDGDTWIWFMNGTSVEAAGRIAIIDPSWTIVGVGNFDGQGRRDIVWYNASLGRIAIWTINGVIKTGSYEFQAPAGGPGEWAVVGIADFDRTGLSDILWRDTHTGALDMWKSVSPFAFISVGIGTVDPRWEVVGTADVEGTGMPDIIWHNNVTGEVYIWGLRNDQVSNAVSLGRYVLNWQIAGLGDFNGDGKQDILWRNNSTGEVCVWLMNGFSVASQWFPGAPSLAWKIVGTPDLNADGKNDILWLDSSARLVTAWLGTPTYLAQPPPFASVGAGWSVAPSR